MAKIKVAVIGAGMMGKNHLKTYKSSAFTTFFPKPPKKPLKHSA